MDSYIFLLLAHGIETATLLCFLLYPTLHEGAQEPGSAGLHLVPKTCVHGAAASCASLDAIITAL